MATKKVVPGNDYELERALRKIVDANCEDIDWEGTEVNKQGIVEDILKYFADKNNHYSLLKHTKSD